MPLLPFEFSWGVVLTRRRFPDRATSGERPISPPASRIRGGRLGPRLHTVSTPSKPIDWRYAACYTNSTRSIPSKDLQSAVSSTTRSDTDSIQAGIECGILGIRRNDEGEAWHYIRDPQGKWTHSPTSTPHDPFPKTNVMASEFADGNCRFVSYESRL